jgi:hypothetical protein
MLLFGPGIDFSNHEQQSKLTRFQGLSDDLDLLLGDEWPSLESHPNAPVLEDWRFVALRVPCLRGRLGKPSLPGVYLPETTSEVIAFSPQLGWARTRHRWYRLGTPDPNREDEAPLPSEADGES